MTRSHIIIHHSLTRDGKELSWDDIKRYHTQTLGYMDIGYHFGIELIDSGYQVLLGRSLLEAGAHCYQEDMNIKSIGVMFCGNFDTGSPPLEMLKIGARLVIVPMMKLFNIPIENIKRHGDYAKYKSCPGTLFGLHELIEVVKGEIRLNEQDD